MKMDSTLFYTSKQTTMIHYKCKKLHQFYLLDSFHANAYTPGMETADINVIHQDHHLLIINKPAGIVIHPTYKHADGTLWDALLAYSQQQGLDGWRPPILADEPDWSGAPPATREMLRSRRSERQWKEEGLLPRPCLLHRLDKDTTGIVALARTERSRRHLIKQFHEHSIQKHYLALVHKGAYVWSRPRTAFTITAGQTLPVDETFELSSYGDTEFLLDGPLQRDPDDRRRCIVGPTGQEARTSVKILAAERGYTLLAVHPITGRTHQIRAHLAALGYAIVGDQLYAPPIVTEQPQVALTRQFLHAYRLTLRRYPDNQPCTFVAPLAADLVTWLACCSPLLFQYSRQHIALP
jgi:23S rRNA pseudouridine1911/1915/1917 synthase